MYICTLNKRNSHTILYGDLSLTSSLFCAVRDFSLVSEILDRLINWLELNRVDFSSEKFFFYIELWITINICKTYWNHTKWMFYIIVFPKFCLKYIFINHCVDLHGTVGSLYIKLFAKNKATRVRIKIYACHFKLMRF